MNSDGPSRGTSRADDRDRILYDRIVRAFDFICRFHCAIRAITFDASTERKIAMKRVTGGSLFFFFLLELKQILY